MADLIFTERFIIDAAQIYSDRVLSHLKNTVSSLETFPYLGSAQLPASILREFGPNVRKLVIPPFDLIYEYNEGEDSITVLALISSRNIT